MKLYVMNGKQINKYALPFQSEEFYSFDCFFDGFSEKCTITLHNINNIWYLKSNGMVNVINNNQSVLDKIQLVEYGIYYIKVLGMNKYVGIYAMPSQEKNLLEFSYKNINNITIGNGSNCNINYNNQFISGVYATIQFKANEWIISGNVNSKTGIFVNDKNVKSAKLKYGDVIFIFGLKIIWMPTFLKINNPNNMVKITGLSIYMSEDIVDNVNVQSVTDEESAIELYKEDDYFYHIPRIKETIEEEEISIDPPPTSQIQEEMPFWLTLGTSLTLVASSIVMIFNIYNNVVAGRNVLMLIPQIIMLFAMVVGSFVMPNLLKRYQKKRAKKREKLRQTRYKEYLETKKQEIEKILRHQNEVLLQNNYNDIKCIEAIRSNNRILWSREIFDDDFLNIRLGLGNFPASLHINAPEEHFTLDKDNLFQAVYDVVDASKILKNVPITYSFLENNISSFIFNSTQKNNYINDIMLKLLTFHSGTDLKIVIFTNKNRENFWNYLKILPHCWNDEKSVRFFATDSSEINEVSAVLDAEFKQRKEMFSSNSGESENIDKNKCYKNFIPYYLIITDDYQNAKNSQIILDILKTKQNYGFSLLTIADSMKSIPNKCEKFIQIGEKDGCILNKELNSKSQQEFLIEKLHTIDMEEICMKLANIPLMPKDGLKEFPTSLPFLEMYNVSKIEQLNILNRWQTNNPVTSLSTIVGVHKDMELFKLDLHEKHHGPHGLVAGMTGSGKSEFIITYILSMAVNYHPYEVQFVLIDYKGGGLAGAFENKETNIRIPHLIGTITNLDTSEMNRTLVSIDSELKRRQKIFNETKDLLGESTIDIYKYQRLYREGRVKKPMAHLFIICDEFAELKSQQPDFMNQLVSTARIGRSLGVHLILATQKPSGVVNDQIWSNSKFKVCLKVQDRSDSMEMLKRPEAASIKEAGRFYLQVGYDDYFDIGQSAWCGAKYVPANKIIKKIDDSISFVNNTGYTIKSINDAVVKEVSADLGDQLTNIVKHICNLSEKYNIKTEKLWLDKIPEIIYVNKLKEKYNYKAKPYCITPIIGEYDSPSTQSQGLLNLDLTFGGNTVIYGQSGSGKENLLSTIIWSTFIEHTTDEVNIYVIDCGAETLKMFSKIPHVGEVVDIGDSDKIYEIFNLAFQEVETRKELFSDYAGNYVNYCQNSGNKLPLIIIIINNYDSFIESYSKLSEDVQSIYRECSKYGIKFIISTVNPSTIRSKMLQNFENKISLQLGSDDAYRNLFGAPRGLLPSKVFGRGIVLKDNNFYEFQTAYFTNPNQMSNVLRTVSQKLNSYYTKKAKKIFIIPEKIGLNSIIKESKGLSKIALGYNIEKKEIETYNFISNKINLILSEEMSEKIDFIYALVRQFAMNEKTNIIILDFVNAFEKEISNTVKFNNNFDSIFNSIYSNLKNDKTSKVKNMYVFIGPGAIKNVVSENTYEIIKKIFTNVNSLENNFFVFADDYDNIKNLKLEDWFQSGVNNSNGIWLGEGIANQMMINVSDLSLDDRKRSFPYMGYTIVNGKSKCIKCVLDEEISNNEEKEAIVLDEK